MLTLFRRFSFPGALGSHCTPETPGSIHEGGELGYSLSHAFGAAFDNPDLIVACCVGDGDPKLARSPPPGTPTNSSIPSATAPSFHSLPQRLQDREPYYPRAHHA